MRSPYFPLMAECMLKVNEEAYINKKANNKMRGYYISARISCQTRELTHQKSTRNGYRCLK